MKRVQAAQIVHQAVAGTQMQMVGVGKLDLTADGSCRSAALSAPLMAPCVPTFMNTGVCTVPCAQVNTPRRACPFGF